MGEDEEEQGRGAGVSRPAGGSLNYKTLQLNVLPQSDARPEERLPLGLRGEGGGGVGGEWELGGCGSRDGW